MGPPGRKPSTTQAPSASARPQRGRIANRPQTPIHISSEEISSDVSSDENEDDLDDTFQAPQTKPPKPAITKPAVRKPLPAPSPRTEDEEEDEREETPYRDDDGLLESDRENEESDIMLQDRDMEEAYSDKSVSLSPVPQRVLDEIVGERVNGVAVHNGTSVGSRSDSLKRKNTDNHEGRGRKRSKSEEEEEEEEEEEGVEEQVRIRGVRFTSNEGGDASTTETRVPQTSAARIARQAASAKKVTGKPAKKQGERAAPPAKKDKGKGREVEPAAIQATDHPEDDDGDFSSDPSNTSSSSGHESDIEDTDMNLDNNPEYNTFTTEIAAIARTQADSLSTSIGTYVTGTTNQAMRNLNAAAKDRERRRERRRKDRRRARRAQRNGEVRRRRHAAASGEPAVQAGVATGTNVPRPAENRDSVSGGGSPDHTASEPGSVQGRTQEVVNELPKPPKPAIKPAKPVPETSRPVKVEKPQVYCRSKTSPHPDEPGCGKLGNGKGKVFNPLMDCGFEACRYKKFCRNCKEGRDASGEFVKNKRRKGVSIFHEDTGKEDRWYCSTECLRFDSEDEEDDRGEPQVNCRAINSQESDEPGCGRKVPIVEGERSKALQAQLTTCWRRCGKRQFCYNCRDGEDEEGNTFKPKGIMVIDKKDGDMWWWCSRECKRLDDRDDPQAWWHDFVKPEPSEESDVPDEEPEVDKPRPPVNRKPPVTGTSIEPPKGTQTYCRNKLSRQPDEPGCQQKGGAGPSALIACGHKLCRYERFCRKCIDGLDARGNPTDGKRAPIRKKGVKVADDDEEEGFRYYCSKECQKNDSAAQTTCRSTTSKETDEPGCGRDITKKNLLELCWHEACGKRRFCNDCRNGVDAEGNDIKSKGKHVDFEDGSSWWWCSKECKRLDDEMQGDKAEWRGYEGDDDDDDDDEGPTPKTKKPDGTECQKCKKTFNSRTKRADCRNPECMHNRDFCEPCTSKTSKPPNGHWLRSVDGKDDDGWFCCKGCRDAIEAPLEAADAVAAAAAEEAKQKRIEEIKRRKEDAKAKAAGTEQAGEAQKMTAVNTEDARAKAAEAAKNRDEKKKQQDKQDKAKLKQTRLTMAKK